MVRLALLALVIGVTLVWAPGVGAAQDGRAAAALLTLGDLPAGWHVSERFSGPTSGDGGFCGDTAPRPGRRTDAAIENAEAGFERGAVGPWIYQAVSVHTPESAANLMDEARTTLVDCDWVDEDDKGMVTRWSLAARPFAALGDDTLAYRLTASADLGTAAFDMVIIRRGDMLSVLLHGAVGIFGPANLDSSLTERMAQRADALMIAVQ
ncbi:MAG: hypothetical protein U0531_01470 [Dehalococcoidia bacterium]